MVLQSVLDDRIFADGMRIAVRINARSAFKNWQTSKYDSRMSIDNR